MPRIEEEIGSDSKPIERSFALRHHLLGVDLLKLELYGILDRGRPNRRVTNWTREALALALPARYPASRSNADRPADRGQCLERTGP